jgi:hypothetical protein
MEQLCGHVVSPATKEQAMMEETFSVRSVPRLYKRTNSSSRLRIADVRSEKLVAEAG